MRAETACRELRVGLRARVPALGRIARLAAGRAGLAAWLAVMSAANLAVAYGAAHDSEISQTISKYLAISQCQAIERYNRQRRAAGGAHLQFPPHMAEMIVMLPA
eukprot:SAG31_NODE_4285_length_3381_cov_1.637112_1_plen_105_part_00